MRTLEKVLITGGAGYIGSHACLVLLQAGYEVVVLDNLCNSSSESLRRVEALAGKPLLFVKGDVRYSQTLQEIFAKHHFSSVLHFAGLKSVGESVAKPLDYYSVNVAGTIALCQAMQHAGIFNLVFSSSASVYGDPVRLPVSEGHPIGNTSSPYARSKLMVEQILQDLASSDHNWKVGVLRYFNPVGAHESGQIGEDPKGTPSNLIPCICQVAVGQQKHLRVFGNDYPTHDGTGIRDYIHVMDVADGHLAALTALKSSKVNGLHVWNLGSGVGYSVLDVVSAFEAASGRTIPYQFMPRRPGDIAKTYADPAKARRDLGWATKRNLQVMMYDAWRWQCQNTEGYISAPSNVERD